MIVKYNALTFPDGEPRMMLERSYVLGDSGASEREKISITIEGDRTCTSAADYETFAAELTAALEDNKDLIVTYSGGEPCTHLTFRAADMVRGPIVVGGPSFPKGEGAELAVGGQRSYRFQLDMERDISAPKNGDIVSFSESITYGGGKPIYQVSESISGDPEIWMTAAKTAFRATQQGEAVGRTAYPEPPAKLWSSCIAEYPIEKSSPSSVYLDEAGTIKVAKMYRVTWRYEFASATDDFSGGAPHKWGSQT